MGSLFMELAILSAIITAYLFLCDKISEAKYEILDALDNGRNKDEKPQ